MRSLGIDEGRQRTSFGKNINPFGQGKRATKRANAARDVCLLIHESGRTARLNFTAESHG